ncbi:hypothetical protein Ait01nite_021930 [Actinoplanes italicus]|nr:hypothetical protein Ait01nite_021930 [Actinoplanes italicus]
MKAGPAVTTVAKIQIASNADSGTATIAMIFERIDQLRLLIKLRPRGSAGNDQRPARDIGRLEGGNDRNARGVRSGRIRNDVRLS